MKYTVRQILNRIQQEKVNRRKMRVALLVLSMFVATGVLWQLKLTGITMTAEALCGQLEHTHTEQCLERTVVCQELAAPGHSHSAECYAPTEPTESDESTEPTEEPTLICLITESAGHSHSDTCYESKYICGFDTEHAHSTLCYSDTDADLETSADWEATLPGISGNPVSDLVNVATSQLGYTESIRNYKVADDGVTQMGYTRYGEWYGNPYGNWNVMFVSFCLHYADHPAYETLKSSGAEAMRLAAERAGLYRAASGTVPSKADLVFLDKDKNGTCDAVAIISSCQESGITFVEGDRDGTVAKNQYAFDHGAILGYALLTEQPDAPESSDVTKSPDATEAPEGSDAPILTLTKDALNPEDNGAAANEVPDEELVPAEEGTIMVTFVIANANYTDDPGNHTTHLSVRSTDELIADGGLTFNAWGSTGKYTVSGTGMLDAFTLPSGTSFAGSGYEFPTVTVENISPEVDRKYSYNSTYSWVTDAGMICNDKTVFTKDTTLSLYLYDHETRCGLNWVCNCDNGGSHNVTFSVSGFSAPDFTWGQSISKPYIPTAAAVNSMYKSDFGCTVGPVMGMEFKGWYVKDADGNEIDFVAGLPILASYVDPDSDGHSVKVYARWEAPEAKETVTATFVNGTETTTAVLEKGQTLGDQLPSVTIPEGQVFLGWQIGDTATYATAETVIEADTTYTAVFAVPVKLTFMNGEGDSAVEFKVIENAVQGALLWDYLPAEEPEYIGTSEMPMVFIGWGWNDGETIDFIPETATVETDTVLYAMFDVAGHDIYLHDIAPDGVTDYELDGQDVEVSQRYLVNGMNLADEFAADPYMMCRDDALASEIKWYTRLETDGQETYVPYDLATPVTSVLHLYTFNYSITLSCEEPTVQADSRGLFTLARTVDVTVSDDGSTLTMILREGEKPTMTDLVIDDVDYSVYNWHFEDDLGNDLNLTLADVLENGVTENIEATASTDDLAIVDTAPSTVRFQVIVNEELKNLVQQEITIYKLADTDSYSISQETLKSVFGEFGFTVENWLANPYSLPQHIIGYDGYWANNPIREANGLYYNPSVGVATSISEVLYLPGMTEMVSGQDWTAFRDTHSFYTMTISDPEGLLYPDESAIPVFPYVFAGESASVTLPAPAGISWNFAGIYATDTVTVTETDNGDGTKTYTISDVHCPIMMTPGYSDLPQANKYINFYVYVNNTRVNVASGTYPVYAIGNKYYLSASLLERIYGDYCFRADQLTDSSQRYFPHTDAGSGTVWTDQPITEHQGAWFSPILNTNSNNNCDVYYAPGYTGTGSDGQSTLAEYYSLYTVSVQDPEHLIYAEGETLPDTLLVHEGETVTITVKTPVDSEGDIFDGAIYSWSDDYAKLTDYIINDNGTTTFTITNVRRQIVLSPKLNIMTVQASDPNHLIYQDGEELPVVQVLKGQAAEITVKASSEYIWLANRKAIEGGVYNSENTHITYTFADVTENITLVPVRPLDSFTISYKISLPSTPTSTVPKVKEGTEYAHTHDGGNYFVLTPSHTQYTVKTASALKTVDFLGWAVDGTDAILPAGEVLTMVELSQYGSEISLTSAWKTLDITHTVSFYINLELQVANYENSTGATPTSNFTSALYGTEVKVEECPQCDDGVKFRGANIIEGPSSSATAATDARIRQLINGVTATYMGEERVFTLGTFPDDNKMLNRIAEEQRQLIQNFENSEWYDPADPTNVTQYRAQGETKDGVFYPKYKIICAINSNGERHYIAPEELTTENYTIRWYVFKYEGTDGWHIDGVLVKKQAQLTITQTFYGDDTAVNEVKQNYSIDIVGINEDEHGSMEGRPTLYTLTLEPNATQQNDPNTDSIEQGYTAYNPLTDTYTWVVNLTADWKAWLYEQNHTSSTPGIVTLSEYMAYNFVDTGYNQNRTTYNDSDGACVAVKAHSIDQDYRTFETVSFYNTYLPSAAVPISKVDENGKPLTGVTFTLQGINQNEPVAATIWQDPDGVYHYRPDSVQDEVDSSWVQVDCIAVDNMGYALVMGLKDKDLNYSFELMENSTPEGYNAIGIPIGFTIDEDGGIHLKEAVQNSNMVHTPDNNTIHVTNSSRLMSVTATKLWEDNTNQKVTLQLMLDDTPLPGRVVELDGTADTPAAGVTDGYESNPWTVTWDDLPAYTGGTKAVYKIKETRIDGINFDANYGDGYADYQVIVEDMKYTAWNGDVPTAAEIKVTNRKQLSGLEFTKTDELGQKLQGAVFQLYQDLDCTKPYGASQTSDTTGTVRFGDLASGIYYMKEIQAPELYLLSDAIYTITVHAGKTTISAYGSETTITQIINESQPATLHLQKVDNDQKPLSGAVFEIWKQGSVSGIYDEKVSREIDGNLTTAFAVNETGALVISDLTRGNYKLVEASAPDGYYRMADPIYFKVEKGQIVCKSTSRLWSFDEKTKIITVVNMPGSELPQTGGMGTHIYTTVGLLMVATSLLYGFYLQRKRKKGAV